MDEKGRLPLWDTLAAAEDTEFAAVQHSVRLFRRRSAIRTREYIGLTSTVYKGPLPLAPATGWRSPPQAPLWPGG